MVNAKVDELILVRLTFEIEHLILVQFQTMKELEKIKD